MLSLSKYITDFFNYAEKTKLELYNEFSLQHELGIYLRNVLSDYKVQFERNISFFTPDTNTIKKEIDISIFNEEMNEKYAIELKFPTNGQYPEQMYSFVKDVKFMEEVKDRGFTKTAAVVFVSDKLFYEGKLTQGIYKHFRNEFSLYGDVYKPTGMNKNVELVTLSKRHDFTWESLEDQRKYYIIEIS